MLVAFLLLGDAWVCARCHVIFLLKFLPVTGGLFVCLRVYTELKQVLFVFLSIERVDRPDLPWLAVFGAAAAELLLQLQTHGCIQSQWKKQLGDPVHAECQECRPQRVGKLLASANQGLLLLLRMRCCCCCMYSS